MVKKYFTSKNITRLAIFTALSVVLYMFVKFPLPFFPAFLEFQFSDLPALLAGFMMGPVSGSIVLILRTLIKLPFSNTVYVGESADLIIGLAFVLPAAFIYRSRRTLGGAIVALAVGTASTVVAAMIVNRFILVPVYSVIFGFKAIIGMVRAVFPAVTDETFYVYYIFGAVLPFNLMRSLICALLTFALYKRLKNLFDRIFPESRAAKSENGGIITKSEAETAKFAEKFAEKLAGGEVILLCGELGAGKTAFVRGLAKGLGITENVTSPTFALMNSYKGRLTLVHIDAYRLGSGKEAYEAGLTEYFYAADTVCCIEWAENIADALTGKNITININYLGKTEREIVIK